MRRTFIILGVLAFLLAVTVGITAWLGKDKFAEQSQAAFLRLEAAVPPPGELPPPRDLASLPLVVRAFLSRVLPAHGRRVSLVRLEQSGRIKVAEEAGWDDFRARQLVSTHPPQMIWAGQAEYLPAVPLMILQGWVGGRSELESSLWGYVSTFRRKGRELQEYLMLRWLGEALWYPGALLGEQVRWEEAPDLPGGMKQARVFLKMGSVTVGGRFIFDPRGGAPFYFWGDPRPDGDIWYANYSQWRRVEGVVIPFQVTEGIKRTISYLPRLEIQLTKVEYR